MNTLFAQTDNYKNVIDNFQTNYNAEKYNEIFSAFSLEMKQALPLDKTTDFLKNLKNQVGKIEDKEFIGFQKQSYATYKTKCEKAILAVNISLDKQNKINGFYIIPYEEPNKNPSNNIINALQTYPKDIATIIFSKSQNLPRNGQLSIAIIQNGNTNYYGVIRVNDSIKPIENHNKVFEIGSLTKVFTSTVLASLSEDEKIKLLDNVNSYYPFQFKGNTTISFESLANHTSGLPRLPKNLDISNESNPYKNYGKNELESYLKNLLKLENNSTKLYSYSNLGAGLLGYTLGLSQKTSFQNLVQEKVFDKYIMNNSFTSSKNLGNKLVKGLSENGNMVSNWDFAVLFGAGGMLSTVEDLSKFANAQFNPENKELALTRKPTFEINKNMKIGLGWHILKSKIDKDLIWHNGGTGGYSSSMAMVVDEKIAVIILSNVSGINQNIDNMCFELIKNIEKK